MGGIAIWVQCSLRLRQINLAGRSSRKVVDSAWWARPLCTCARELKNKSSGDSFRRSQGHQEYKELFESQLEQLGKVMAADVLHFELLILLRKTLADIGMTRAAELKSLFGFLKDICQWQIPA